MEIFVICRQGGLVLQPFGLFSLLQTLMGEQTTTPTPNNTEPKNVENTTEPPPTTQEENNVSQENRQAVLQFLQAHEQRAKRTKR